MTKAAPALLAVAYFWLILTGFAEAPAGGFGSIIEVRALFASDAALTAGWLHYLAFDLVVGTLIVWNGLSAGTQAPISADDQRPAARARQDPDPIIPVRIAASRSRTPVHLDRLMLPALSNCAYASSTRA